jgi:hypothetical protein
MVRVVSRQLDDRHVEIEQQRAVDGGRATAARRPRRCHSICLFGCWIAVALAAVSAIGIFLGFPQRPAAIFAPAQRSNALRVQLRSPNEAGVATVMVDDRSGAASNVPQPAGDRIALWIRWIHEGTISERSGKSSSSYPACCRCCWRSPE